MRKAAMLIVLLLMFISSPAVQGMNKDELQYIGEFIVDSNLPVTEWEVVMKEYIPADEIESHRDRFEDSHLATSHEEENVIKYQLVEDFDLNNIRVSRTLLIPRDDTLQAEVIAVLEGSGWDEEIERAYLRVKRTLTEELFNDNYQYFACLSTEKGGIINPDVFLEKLTNRFNLQQKMTQFDSIENSTHKKMIYGYTDLWNSKINIEDTPVNMQIALTATDTQTQQYTIGTPILISEY